MLSFALIAEGITDQAVLETLLEAHYRDEIGEEVDINPLQPLRDATDEARQDGESFGGWEKVLEFCGIPERLVEALELNDYIVIQIDTDCCEHVNFGVSYRDGGVDRSVSQLIEAVRENIVDRIGKACFLDYSDRFLFAIAVHSTECWLLPFHATSPAHVRKIVSCEAALKFSLGKAGRSLTKDYRNYLSLSSHFKNNEYRQAAIQNNESLALFVSSLPGLAAQDPVQ